MTLSILLALVLYSHSDFRNDILDFSKLISPHLSKQEMNNWEPVSPRTNGEFYFILKRDMKFRGFNCKKGMKLESETSTKSFKIFSLEADAKDMNCAKWGFTFSKLHFFNDSVSKFGLSVINPENGKQIASWKNVEDVKLAMPMLRELNSKVTNNILVAEAHPEKQKRLNVVLLDGGKVQGIQFPKGATIRALGDPEDINGKLFLSGATLLGEDYITYKNFPCSDLTLDLDLLSNCTIAKEVVYGDFVFLKGALVSFFSGNDNPVPESIVNGDFKYKGKLYKDRGYVKVKEFSGN